MQEKLTWCLLGAFVTGIMVFFGIMATGDDIAIGSAMAFSAATAFGVFTIAASNTTK